MLILCLGSFIELLELKVWTKNAMLFRPDVSILPFLPGMTPHGVA